MAGATIDVRQLKVAVLCLGSAFADQVAAGHARPDVDRFSSFVPFSSSAGNSIFAFIDAPALLSDQNLWFDGLTVPGRGARSSQDSSGD